MGREIKRVPLTFNWPLRKTWKGYLNPHYEGHSKNCSNCDGNGLTMARQRLEDLVSLLMLSGCDSRRGKCHPYFDRMDGLHYTQGIAPSSDLAELTEGLAGRKMSDFIGHDAMDRLSAVGKIIKAAGLKEKWGVCQVCKGEGTVWDLPENKRKASQWRKSEPPKGKAYQVWETVSEGSPITPPFATPEELADYWLAHRNSCDPSDRETILKWINGPGWAPSFIMTGAKLEDGVTALSNQITTKGK
jgi:hypothetical protein